MRLTQSPDVWPQSLPSQNHRLKAWHNVGVHVCVPVACAIRCSVFIVVLSAPLSRRATSDCLAVLAQT